MIAGYLPASLRNQMGLVLWGSFCLLLVLGILTTLLDLRALPANETRHANDVGARAIIDAVTGQVAVSTGKEEKKPEFEVEAPKPGAPAGVAPAKSADASPEEKLPEGLPALRTTPLDTAMPAPGEGQSPLVTAPAREITETVDDMELPKHGEGEAAIAAKIYARPFAAKPETKPVSIVVLDAGISAQSLPLIMALPRTVTIAFSPYATGVSERIAAFRAAGFESWAMLPSMGERYPNDDPGPLGLVATLPKDELLRRLRVVLSQTIGSVGIVLPVDEAISKKTNVFLPLITEIEARGLYLLSTHPTRTTDQIAPNKKLQAILRRTNLMIDTETDEAAITANLNAIPELIGKKEGLIVVTTARPQSLLLLAKWLEEHPFEEPVALAPLSAQWLEEEKADAPPAAEASGGHGGGHGGAEKKSSGHGSEKKPEAKKSSGGHH